MFDWPVVGWIGAHGGIHPVDRDDADIEAFRLATRILEKGYVLLVFPEGTRSPTGELQEAKDGIAMLALRTGAQIVPMGINNTDACGRRAARCRRRSRGRRSASGSATRSASRTSSPRAPTGGPPRRSPRPRSWAASPSSSIPVTGASTRAPSDPGTRSGSDRKAVPDARTFA